MNCEQLLDFLNEYVDGAAAPGDCTAIEAHLDACDQCRLVVDNVRQTISICREGQMHTVPEAFRDCLRDAIKVKWREIHPDRPCE